MVFSVKANKKRIMAVLIVIVVIVVGIFLMPKTLEAPTVFKGETNAERIEFISSFGWVVSQEPIDTRDVTIPADFSEVYTSYNNMQVAQGFDLKVYSGQICTQYVYLIENYPNETRQVHLTLLVYEGMIIGGDVSCAEVDGFMHGFAIDSLAYGESETTTDTQDAVESQDTLQTENTVTQETAGQVVEP